MSEPPNCIDINMQRAGNGRSIEEQTPFLSRSSDSLPSIARLFAIALSSPGIPLLPLEIYPHALPHNAVFIPVRIIVKKAGPAFGYTQGGIDRNQGGLGTLGYSDHFVIRLDPECFGLLPFQDAVSRLSFLGGHKIYPNECFAR